jgi:hypothetical protein
VKCESWTLIMRSVGVSGDPSVIDSRSHENVLTLRPSLPPMEAVLFRRNPWEEAKTENEVDKK